MKINKKRPGLAHFFKKKTNWSILLKIFEFTDLSFPVKKFLQKLVLGTNTI